MVVRTIQRAHICHKSAEWGDVERLPGLPCRVQSKIEGVLFSTWSGEGARADMRNLDGTQVLSIPVHSSMEKLVTRQSHGLQDRGCLTLNLLYCLEGDRTHWGGPAILDLAVQLGTWASVRPTQRILYTWAIERFPFRQCDNHRRESLGAWHCWSIFWAKATVSLTIGFSTMALYVSFCCELNGDWLGFTGKLLPLQNYLIQVLHQASNPNHCDFTFFLKNNTTPCANFGKRAREDNRIEDKHYSQSERNSQF